MREKKHLWLLGFWVVGLLLLQAISSLAFADDERCVVCHTVQGWQPAKFNHDRTGFLLKGRHAKVLCQQCHQDATYAKMDKKACADCHHDPHVSELGKSCEKCHNESGWLNDISGSGSLLAHRRTNFPLVGRHATIPCQECHANSRERTFSRVATTCYGCHQADYQSTATKSVDHVAAGFSTKCETCHSPLHWLPATGFADHDNCFVITQGPHKGFGCTSCHSSAMSSLTVGSCGGSNFTCTGCHTGTHAQPVTDAKHQAVLGYQYKSSKCYECHNHGTTN